MFPVIEGISFNNSGNALTPWPQPANVPLPVGVMSGDLLLLAIQTSGSGYPSKITVPAGWTQFASQHNVSGRLTLLYRWADGSEGSQVNIGLGNASGTSWSTAVYRISGANPAQNPIVGSANIGLGKSPNPPGLTLPVPTDALWLEIIGIASSGGTVSQWSTDYVLGQTTTSSGPIPITNTGTGIGMAGHQSTAITEDPDQLLITVPTVNARWIANTVAIVGL